jgi:hypothetical protein
MSDDTLWIRIVRAHPPTPTGFDAAVLERLARSPLPGPATVEAGGRERPVRGWSDPKLAEVLGRGRRATILTAPGLRADRLTGDELIWSFFCRQRDADAVRGLFVDLCRIVGADYGRAHLSAEGIRLNEEHYARHERTFHMGGLYWLNWFGPEEAERQGGLAAVRANPYARTEVFGKSLLVEVGAGPLDARTAAGRQRLLDATAALPPVRPEPEPRPETVGGVRGVRDPVDRSLWVNLHVADGRRLPASRITDIAAVAGHGEPPVSAVHVLFSGREAAAAHAAAFQALGVRVWYVDDETGRPSPVT